MAWTSWLKKNIKFGIALRRVRRSAQAGVSGRLAPCVRRIQLGAQSLFLSLLLTMLVCLVLGNDHRVSAVHRRRHGAVRASC